MSVQEQAAQRILSLPERDARLIMELLDRIIPQNTAQAEALQTRASLDFSSYGRATERGRNVEQYMEEIRGNDRF